MARIAFVSREVHPLRPGGIGQFVTAAATLLADELDVLILTTAMCEEDYHRLRDTGDERLPPVPIEFVAEPTWPELQSHFSLMHAYSARAYARLRELYPDGGPEVIEFPDYIGEGFVTGKRPGPSTRSSPAPSCACAPTRRGSSRRSSTATAIRSSRRAPPRELERYSLAHADRLIWQGGDVLGAYRRFYGRERLAPAVRIRYPYLGPVAERAPTRLQLGDEPLRLLYVGRLERRKGIQDLVFAVTRRESDDVRLTIVGGDTPTGPLGVSMRDQLLATAAEDPRIELTARSTAPSSPPSCGAITPSPSRRCGSAGRTSASRRCT